jgi:hypothetical protein
LTPKRQGSKKMCMTSALCIEYPSANRRLNAKHESKANNQRELGLM